MEMMKFCSRGACSLAAAVSLLFVAAATAWGQVGTAFTYQGRLEQSGVPVTGMRNFTFRLYNSPSTSNQQGPTIGPVAIDVQDGLFTTELDFGAGPFNGQELWLQIIVEGQSLSPRQPVTVAPYAMQTRGMFVDDDEHIGINMAPNSTRRVGVGGQLYAETGGQQAPSAIRGVLNESFALAAGVEGLSFGEGNLASGVHGQWVGNNPAHNASGVFGWLRDQFGSDGAGVRGVHEGTGIGVYGESDGTGVRGVSPVSSGKGVAGHSHPNGWAGYFTGGRNYFEGNVGIGVTGPAAKLDVSAVGDGTSAIVAESNTPVGSSAAVLARNAFTGPAIQAEGIGPIEPDGSGGVVRIGAPDGMGAVVAIDGNDIVSRLDADPTTLHLNRYGGAVRMGEHGVRPAHAYGKILFDGTVLSSSPNILGVTASGDGEYDITIDGGWNDATDIAVVTVGGRLNGGSIETNGALLRVITYNLIDVIDECGGGGFCDGSSPHSFHFVIYRP